MQERSDWTFNSARGTIAGSHILDGRTVICLEADGAVAWKRSFHRRSEAEACYQGDLRAMRKNGLYHIVTTEAAS